MIDEAAVKAAVDNLCERLKIPGFIFLYLDGGNIKVVGEMSVAELLPMILRMKK